MEQIITINEAQQVLLLEALGLLRERVRQQAFETSNVAGINTRYIEHKKHTLYKIDNLIDSIL
jgi:hypothetical protein